MGSMVSDKLGLVVPTLNEAGNIPTLLERLRASLDPIDPDYEVLVVDDNSSDDTQRIVTERAHSDPRVKLLVRVNERGLAGAVLHGWANCDAGILGVIDADLQHPPELLPTLLSAVRDGHDIAIGSRYVNGHGDSTAGWNPARRLASAMATWVTYPLQRPGIRVKDPMSGFFMVRREAIKDIRLHPEGFKILLEILVRGRIKSAAEIPYRFGLRYAGKSKANVKVALDYATLLGRLSVDAFLRPGS
jgi:dolichol-phosphate mannosyltransferase